MVQGAPTKIHDSREEKEQRCSPDHFYGGTKGHTRGQLLADWEMRAIITVFVVVLQPCGACTSIDVPIPGTAFRVTARAEEATTILPLVAKKVCLRTFLWPCQCERLGKPRRPDGRRQQREPVPQLAEHIRFHLRWPARKLGGYERTGHVACESTVRARALCDHYAVVAPALLGSSGIVGQPSVSRRSANSSCVISALANGQ